MLIGHRSITKRKKKTRASIISVKAHKNCCRLTMRLSDFFFVFGNFLILAHGELYLRDAEKKYDPNWESLDSRPLPKWYDDAKFGIFIHWGVFSVPSFGSEWFWSNWQISNKTKYVQFMRKNYPPNFTYQDFAKDFTAEFFDPDRWVDLFADSGARYVVLTSKHHEGYTLWPSKNSFSWNSKDVGPNRDLVGELATALRTRHPTLKFGLYHSLYEWFNPLYREDASNNFKTCNFVRTKTMPELYDLVISYEPEVVWSDGDWEAPDDYWSATDFLAWLYNDSPVRESVVTNDRWGKDTLCKHGDFYTCKDRYSPGVLQPHKWENCLTIDRTSWGFRRNAQLSEYMTIEELIGELAKTVSCGGNMLVNVGPTKDGIITPIYEERLRQIGSWLSVNGEAIYYSQSWTYQNDTIAPRVWYTSNKNSIYAIVLYWPKGDILMLGSPKMGNESTVQLLGYDGGESLPWETFKETVKIKLPKLSEVKSKWAYVFKISDVAN